MKPRLFLGQLASLALTGSILLGMVSRQSFSDVSLKHNTASLRADDPRNALLCGQQAVYLLLRLLDIPVDYDQLLSYAPAQQGGTSLLELKQLCQRLGLEAEVRRCSKEEIRKLELPVIAHVRLGLNAKQGHYVVFTRRLDADRLEVIDPTAARIKVYRIDRLDNVWQGYLLVPTRQRLGRTALSVAALSFLLAVIGALLFRKRQLKRQLMP